MCIPRNSICFSSRRASGVLLRSLAVFFGLVATSATTHAQELTWKSKVVELKPELAALAPTTVLEVRYAFANDSRTPVDITAVESDCGCTVPELTKHLYAPGETGELRAKFLVGDRTGRHEKHILVKSNDGKEPTALTLIVDLPEMVRLSPTALNWSQGESNAPKTISLEAGEGFTIEEATATSSQALFHVKVRTLEAGHHYELSVTPERTDLPFFAQLAISCKLRPLASPAVNGNHNGKEASTLLAKVFTAYASVKASMHP